MCSGEQALRQDQVGQVAELFSLLGDPNRLRIVLACLDGARSVGEIAEEVGASQSLTSHHLRLLRTARLLRPERAGRTVRYALDDDHVRDVIRTMVSHVCDPHEHRAGEADPDHP
ncbi:MAG: metalloregulator ArsR/SmtB family transcription factor [Methylobacterium frigidaeris]